MGFINRKRVLDLSKGFRGRAKNCIKIARNRVEKALQHNYRHRKLRTREQRRLWTTRINAAGRQHGLPYSVLIGGMAKSQVQVNRKMLADLAQFEPLSFRAVCDAVAREQGIERRVPASDGWVATAVVESDGVDPFLKPRRKRKNRSLVEKMQWAMTLSAAQQRRLAERAAAAGAAAVVAGTEAEAEAETEPEAAKQ